MKEVTFPKYWNQVLKSFRTAWLYAFITDMHLPWKRKMIYWGYILCGVCYLIFNENVLFFFQTNCDRWKVDVLQQCGMQYKNRKMKKKKKVKETTTNHTKGQSSSNKVMLNTRLAFGMINGGRLEESSLMWVASGKAIYGF